MTEYRRSERPGVMTMVTRRVILMPRWGVKNTIIKEYAISLPRIPILEREGGFGEDDGPAQIGHRQAD